MNEQTGNAKAGEAGHSGRDRQPTKTSVPDPSQPASPGDVKARSHEALSGMKNTGHDKADMNHPGPNREEAERSKGDAHHDQHEKQKEMKHEKL